MDVDHTFAKTTCQLDVSTWYRRVYALCQSRLKSTVDAEDATQETFLRGFARMDELRSQEAIGGWLRGIAKHVCIDFVRRQKVRKTSDADIESVVTTRDDDVGQREQRQRLIQMVQDLPEPLAEIVLLHYYEQMTYDEMAKWLDIARSTVNERLSKARQKLRQKMLETEQAQ